MIVDVIFDDGNKLQCDSYSCVRNMLKLLFYSNQDEKDIVGILSNTDCSKFTINILANNRNKKIRFVNYKLLNIIRNITDSTGDKNKTGKLDYIEVYFVKEE